MASKRRRHRLAHLALIAALSSAAYTTIAPILPLEFSNRGISERWVSMIFLSFSAGSAIAPPLVSKRFESHGTMAVMAWSMAGMGMLFLILGFVFEVAKIVSPAGLTADDGDGDGGSKFGATIGMIALVVQFAMGALLSAVSTGYYSLATLVFDEKETAMSVIEAAIGIGYILGPIVGSFIYAETSYHTAYGLVSFGMMILAVATWRCISPHFAHRDEDEDASGEIFADEEAKGEFIDYNSVENDGLASNGESGMQMSMEVNMGTRQIPTEKPTAMSLLKHPQMLISAATITWVNVAWTCIEPLLAKRLSDHFHIGTKQIGVIFSLNNVVYVPAVFLTQYLPTHGNLRHRTIALSTLLTPVCVLSVGSASYSLLIAGVLLLGLIPTPVWIMLLPFMQEESFELVPDPLVRRRLNDVTAGTYNSFMLLGQVVGYALGAWFGSRGFELTTRFVALLIFAQGILFYFGTDTRGQRSKYRDRCRYQL